MSAVSNPASAIGEAIGHIIEREVLNILTEEAQKHGCKLVTSGDKGKKLLLKDKWGNRYDIDSVIKNQRDEPVILVESKYLRYKKHMRDKGSWICVAHPNLRLTYPTIRSCVAVLIGDWTKGSRDLLISHDITVLEVPFSHVADILASYGINYRWGEKDRELAVSAWNRFSQLSDEDKCRIGKRSVQIIEANLRETIHGVLSDKERPRIKKTEIRLKLSSGEIYAFDFNDIESLQVFTKDLDLEKAKNTLTREKLKGTLKAYIQR